MTTFDSNNKGAGIDLSEGDLKASSELGDAPYTVRSTTSHNSGIRYFEVTPHDYYGNQQANVQIGVCTAGLVISPQGQELHNRDPDGFGWDDRELAVNNGEVVGVLCNFTTREMTYITDAGQTLGAVLPEGVDYFAAVTLYGEPGQPSHATANFAGPFVRALPQGADAWDAASQPVTVLTYQMRPDESFAVSGSGLVTITKDA